MSFIPLALNTLKETIRDKVLYVILIFALIMISSGLLLSFLSLNQQSKIVMDLGLSSISIFGLILTVFVGTSLVSKEIDKKTIYLLISKPIRRSGFIFGKFLGLSITLLIIMVAMAITFYAVLWYTLSLTHESIWTFVPNSAMALILIYLEMMLLTASAIFFSTFASPVMSAMFTLGVYIIGHMSNDLLSLGEMSGQAFFSQFTQLIFYILPDLERLNLKNVLMSQPVSMEIFGSSLAYGLSYIAALLILSMVIFEGKEF